MSQAQRDYVKMYLSRLHLHLDQNVGPYVAHKLAAEYSKGYQPLPEDEQAEVDAWLDEQHPERKKEPEGEKGRSLFDGLPGVR